MPTRLGDTPPVEDTGPGHTDQSMYDFLAPVAATWAFAVAMPLLDLLGRNPPFLVAHDLVGWRLVAFALAVALSGPVLLGVLLVSARSWSTRVGHALQRSVVALLAGVTFLAIASPRIDASVITIAVPTLAFAALVVLALRRPVVRQFIRFLALAPVAACAVFLLASPASALLDTAASGGSGGTVISRPAPVFLMVFDELPLTSLLHPDGSIDSSLYPNFAKLSDDSTWFRNATTISMNTARAIPSILTGRPPKGQDVLPVASQHPDSLFELLPSYRIVATEPVTRLCQMDNCHTPLGPGSARTPLRSTVMDTTLVLLHQVLPPNVASGLPPIDENWAGFAEDDGQATQPEVGSSEPPLDAEAHEELLREALWADSSQAVAGFASSIADATARSVYFGHFLLPHAPWRRLPDGRMHDSGKIAEPALAERGTWGDNTWLITDAYRRHLLQLQFTDRMLGTLREQIEASGLWQDALVIVMADHGITFTANSRRRTAETPEAAADVVHVPLFIKYPDQVDQGISDYPATITDIAPTVADVLGLEGAPSYPGTSLLDPPTPAPADARNPLAVSSRTLAEAARRKYELFDLASPRPGFYAYGAHKELMGHPSAELRSDPTSHWTAHVEGLGEFEDVELGESHLPALLSGNLEARNPDSETPNMLAIALNGKVAGLARPYVAADGSSVRFQTLLDPKYFVDGTNELQLFEIAGRSPARLRRMETAG